MTARQVFGGSLSFSLPSSFRSEGRHQIDQQEIFVEAHTGRTLLVHVTEQDELALPESARFMFTGISKQMGGEHQILLERQLPPTHVPHLG
jgi:hypothetical protein